MLRFLALAIALGLGAPPATDAHPHVFIDYWVTLVLAGESLQGSG